MVLRKEETKEKDMYVASRNRKQIVNLKHVTQIYIGPMGSIKADFAGGKTCSLEKYETAEETNEAMKRLTEAIGTTEIFVFPYLKK